MLTGMATDNALGRIALLMILVSGFPLWAQSATGSAGSLAAGAELRWQEWAPRCSVLGAWRCG